MILLKYVRSYHPSTQISPMLLISFRVKVKVCTMIYRPCIPPPTAFGIYPYLI